MASDGNGLRNFALGIVGSVIAAVIGFALIGPGGVLNHTKHKSGPEVRISAINGPDQSAVGDIPSRRFTVYNAGETAGEMCVVFWNPFGPDPDDVHALLSEEFTVTPGQTVNLTIQAQQAYASASVFDEGADVACGDVVSPTVTRPVNTFG